MTDRKQALIDLRDKVKAEDCHPKDILSVFLNYMGDCGQWAHDAYFHGSLDAARALHDAVLPGWEADISLSGEVLVYEVLRVDGFLANRYGPSSAWLLAILEALIAQEEQPK